MLFVNIYIIVFYVINTVAFIRAVVYYVFAPV